jgi:hypothetical protein
LQFAASATADTAIKAFRSFEVMILRMDFQAIAIPTSMAVLELNIILAVLIE